MVGQQGDLSRSRRTAGLSPISSSSPPGEPRRSREWSASRARRSQHAAEAAGQAAGQHLAESELALGEGPVAAVGVQGAERRRSSFLPPRVGPAVGEFAERHAQGVAQTGQALAAEVGLGRVRPARRCTRWRAPSRQPAAQAGVHPLRSGRTSSRSSTSRLRKPTRSATSGGEAFPGRSGPGRAAPTPRESRKGNDTGRSTRPEEAASLHRRPRRPPHVPTLSVQRRLFSGGGPASVVKRNRMSPKAISAPEASSVLPRTRWPLTRTPLRESRSRRNQRPLLHENTGVPFGRALVGEDDGVVQAAAEGDGLVGVQVKSGGMAEPFRGSTARAFVFSPGGESRGERESYRIRAASVQ